MTNHIHTRLSNAHRWLGTRAIRSLATAAALASIAGAFNAASASLIGSTYSLRIEGQVKIGAQISTEGYAATPVFDTFLSDVPNTIVPTPDPPFDPGQALRVNETETANHVIVWVRGPNGGPETFVNPLDPASLVEFETIFTFPGLGPGEMIIPSDIEMENFGVFYDPQSTQVSGLGTQASPLKILLLLDPDDVLDSGTSHLKLHFDYDEGLVPEPASLALVGLGLLGVAGLTRRRS